MYKASFKAQILRAHKKNDRITKPLYDYKYINTVFCSMRDRLNKL